MADSALEPSLEPAAKRAKLEGAAASEPAPAAAAPAAAVPDAADAAADGAAAGPAVSVAAAPAVAAAAAAAETTVDRVPKRKVALLFGYCGTAYRGLQKNPGVDTVEERLERAIYEAGGISDANFGELQKVKWSRAARTDAGVHAVGQCCALKMQLEGPEEPAVYAAAVKRVNAKLPADIRLFVVVRVTNKFNAKLACDRRRYEYLLPAAVLRAEGGGAGGREWAEQQAAEWAAEHPAAAEAVPAEHRVSVGALNRVLARYKGTHNFHNFTTGKKPDDPSARRHILSYVAERVAIVEGVAYVRCVVLGQSFMLNQIRKMLAMAVVIVRGLAPPATMDAAFKPERMAIPMLPGNGLFLDQCVFENYARKFSDRQPITLAGAQAAVESFKAETLYPGIAKVESESEEWAEWQTKIGEKQAHWAEAAAAEAAPQ